MTVTVPARTEQDLISKGEKSIINKINITKNMGKTERPLFLMQPVIYIAFAEEGQETMGLTDNSDTMDEMVG